MSPLVRVSLIAASLILSIGSAAAADSTDNLEQMRAVLAGRVATLAAPASEPEQAVKQIGDAQQSARELLLGIAKSNAGAAGPATSSEASRPNAIRAKGLLAYDDVQAMARRLLLGQASGS
jgi:hypothetical protein